VQRRNAPGPALDLGAEWSEQELAGLRDAAADDDSLGRDEDGQVRDCDPDVRRRTAYGLPCSLVATARRNDDVVERGPLGGCRDRPCAGQGLEAAAVSAAAERAVLDHGVVTDLAGSILDAEMKAAPDYETTADPGSADDAQDVLGAAGSSDPRLRERERVAVVDQAHGPVEGICERFGDRPADPVAVEVGQEHRAAVDVEEPGQRDADRGHRPGLAREPRQPVEDCGDAFVGSGRLGVALHDVVAVEDDALDVRSAQVEAEPSHRAVQPPSTVRTAPVTKGAVAR
jgi:hypothetical protein